MLGACAAPPPPAPPRLPILDPDSACLKDLRDHHVAFEPVESVGEGSCAIGNPVRVTADSNIAWNHPGLVSCSMARAIDRFDAQVVQPAAKRVFGQPVVKLYHMGTYNCRNRRTETQVAGTNVGSRGGRLSEHARGHAIDVGSFQLADGTVISVKHDWQGAGKKSEFLQAVARASCQQFNVVLTPNYNRLHQDHLHLDIGPHRLCGM